MWSLLAKLIVILVVGGLVAVKARTLCRDIEPPVGICAIEASLWPKLKVREVEQAHQTRQAIHPLPSPAVPFPQPKPRREHHPK